jgi:geranylgeranyl diphosphate synthase type II
LDVDAYMTERIALINGAIEDRFERATDWPESLRGAMRHLLFPGGKRLRPVFSMAAAEAVGAAPTSALPMGVAVELIHTYSLVHDDLPCMDDDDERRGRPTVHVAYDEATAVLAGDALLTEAFAALSDADESGSTADERMLAIACLAKAAGASGLVGGQIDDLAFDSTRNENAGHDGASDRSGTDHDQLASIHARKTAALFQAAIVGGAVLASANAAERATLAAFAADIGIAFQIADDVLDADKDEAASILRLLGIEDAKAGGEALLARALERIEGWGERAEPLRELARFAVRRNR